MEFFEGVRAAAFAAVLLAATELGIRQWVMMLSVDYEDFDGSLRPLSCVFPKRRRFQIAKMLLGLCSIASFVAAMRIGASDHLDVAFATLALFALYCIVSYWTHVKAFRHFAAHHLTLRARTGYRGL